MSRMAKSTLLVTLLLPLALGGCVPKKGTTSPEDYYPLIQVALGVGQTAAAIGRDQSIQDGNFELCVVSDVLSAAFGSAGEVLGGNISGQPVIPGIDLDLTDCLALWEKPAEEDSEEDSEEAPADDAEGESASARTVVVGVLAAPAEEAPAEEAKAEEKAEEKPVEEKAEEKAEEKVEEKPAEEAKAEEKAEEAPAEEAKAEEPPAVKGNPKVALMIDAVAGITLTAVLSYATKLKAANCKKGTLALAAIHYVNGMIKPIADEIESPDGKVTIPAFPVDLSECTED